MVSMIRLAIAAIFSVWASVAVAQTCPEMQNDSPVILEIQGILAGEGVQVPATHCLTRAEFIALPQSDFTTSTIWTDGEVTFSGVYLRDLLAYLNVKDGMIDLWAVNDYFVDMSVAEGLEDDALIASHMNGQEMTLRNKGPLWLIYPFDYDERYKSELYFSRSIWQLVRLEIIAP